MSYRNAPYSVEVKAGEKYAFCTCGRSADPPFCDGAHKGTGMKSKKVTFEQDQQVFICGCGKTKNSPLCDGAHRDG